MKKYYILILLMACKISIAQNLPNPIDPNKIDLTISSDHGPRSYSGGMDFHPGIDYPSAKYTYSHAIVADNINDINLTAKVFKVGDAAKITIGNWIYQHIQANNHAEWNVFVDYKSNAGCDLIIIKEDTIIKKVYASTLARICNPCVF